MIRYLIWDVDGTLLDVTSLHKFAFPGVRAVCDYIRSIGGANFLVSQRTAKRLSEVLREHELWEEFAECVTADDKLPQEPEAVALEWLIGKNYLPRDEVLFIGDDELDILAGQAAGVRTCRFGEGPTFEAKPDMVVESYGELYETLCWENGDGRLLRGLRELPAWFFASPRAAARCQRSAGPFAS